MLKPLTHDIATTVYALLRLVGALASEQENFVRIFSSDHPPSEWRFQGDLGFGGKFYYSETAWRVGCYVEDDNPRRLESIAAANIVLNALRSALKS